MGLAQRPSNPLITVAGVVFLLPALTITLASPLHQALRDWVTALRDAYAIAMPETAVRRLVADRFGGTKQAKSTHEAIWAQPGDERELSALAFPTWSAAIHRHNKLERAAAGFCDAPNDGLCRLVAWHRYLDSLRDLPRVEQIEQVNRYVNTLRYGSDQILWGRSDYWAAPDEFLARGGDCEDFAIAKFYSLKRLGFAPEAMRIVVLRDLQRNVKHAVLAVRLEGREVLLDNLDDKVKDWSQAQHYEPIYSVNEQRSWVHPAVTNIASHDTGS